MPTSSSSSARGNAGSSRAISSRSRRPSNWSSVRASATAACGPSGNASTCPSVTGITSRGRDAGDSICSMMRLPKWAHGAGARLAPQLAEPVPRRLQVDRDQRRRAIGLVDGDKVVLAAERARIDVEIHLVAVEHVLGRFGVLHFMNRGLMGICHIDHRFDN
ncbi:hypothetical protein BVI434_150037 [Burkholderia vietnamiensis]|nr:hypothetical protein BVI434_150037 [Burkholderia vietnamiensis]